MRRVAAGAAIAFLSGIGLAGAEERGRDGELRVLYWQAPSNLNPYLSGGSKDIQAASLVLEPLARFNEAGEMTPWLAETIPTVENGGVSADLTRVTWTLRPGLKWSDGSPVTASDVAFTAEYCMNENTGCAHKAQFSGVAAVTADNPRSVTITFEQPTPYPYAPFVGPLTPVLQKAQFESCAGSDSPECIAANYQPVGTGPFTVEEFRPKDAIRLAANAHYRDPAKPAFANVYLKGGGDAAGAARAVLETGEFDYGWNLQLTPEVLGAMAESDKGVLLTGFGTLVERIMLNTTNPDPALGPKDRAVKRPHPVLSDAAVREALSLAIDRGILVEAGYGVAARVACNLIAAPEAYRSRTFDCETQDISRANDLLDAAGWVRGADGVRVKDGQRLALRFNTSVNAARQDAQAMIKAWWSEIGVETTLRAIPASVFFSTDPENEDSFVRFYADVEMYANRFDGADPQGHLGRYLCEEVPTPANDWGGGNISRHCDPAYDALHAELTTTAGLEERALIVRRLNDMLIRNGALIPLAHRGSVSARSRSLEGVVFNVWDSELWNAADWRRAR